MKNFALIDEKQIVIAVTPLDIDEEGDGIDFLFNVMKIQEKVYPNAVTAKIVTNVGIGYTYIEDLNTFRSPKPFNSWILSNDKTNWVPPIEKPVGNYYWDEEILNWILYE